MTMALQNIEHARLPAVYEAAKTALAECSQLDECQAWADKAEAAASYARQANDETLRRYCDRIQARAIRRLGEVLKQIPPQHGVNQNISNGDVTKVTRTAAAEAAGITLRQRRTAIRVANLPDQQFETAVESLNPPTVTQLAEQGIQRRPSPNPITAEHTEAQRALASLLSLAGFCSSHDPRQIARFIRRDRITEARKAVSLIDGWLDAFVVNLGDNDDH